MKLEFDKVEEFLQDLLNATEKLTDSLKPFEKSFKGLLTKPLVEMSISEKVKFAKAINEIGNAKAQL